jgi:hypothetical protein
MTLRDVLRRLEEIERAELEQRRRLREALVLDIERFLFLTEGTV